jgi:hypothetical protein
MQASGTYPDVPAIEAAPMTLLDVERNRSRRAQRKHQKQANRKQKVRSQPVGIGNNMGPPLPLNDDQVLTFREWCQLNRISPRNGRRIIASGAGPRVVQLSARRMGVTIRANREWQTARER